MAPVMKKIPDLLSQKQPTLSFELFPPKTEEGYKNLLTAIKELAALQPDFFSCTYGAGGGSRERTFDIAQHIQKNYRIPAVAHLTCVCNSREEIRTILLDIKNRGINNVLALRGDPPKENPDWQPGPENFKYSSELCAFIRHNFADHFGIGVAGFPEGHILCPDRELDAKYLKIKIDNGADFVITQLFFNNQDYFDYVQRLCKLGVRCPVIPGIMPIADYTGLVRFCQKCGTTITPEVRKIFEPIAENKEKVLAAGIKFTVRQCQELLAAGVPGLHFYTLNKIAPTAEIVKALAPALCGKH